MVLLRAPAAVGASACETLAGLLKGASHTQQQLRAGAGMEALAALLARCDDGGEVDLCEAEYEKLDEEEKQRYVLS